MSVFLKYLVISSFCFSSLVYAQSTESIFRYRIKMAEVPFNGDVSDSLSGVVAQVLKSTPFGKGFENCIDLRTLGSTSSTSDGLSILNSGTIGVLMNERISREALGEIKDRFCGGWLKRMFSSCGVSIDVEEVRLDQLNMVAVGFAPHDHKLHPEFNHARSLRTNQKLPQFSKGCETGNHNHSWKNAASTVASKKYLQSIGIDLNQARTLNLRKQDGTEFWDFGFPRPRLSVGNRVQSSERQTKGSVGSPRETSENGKSQSAAQE